MSRFTSRFLVIALAAIGLVVGYFLLQTYWSRTAPATAESGVTVVIPAGSHFNAIVDTLDRAGLIGDHLSFEILAKVTGAENEIKSGTYKFASGISHADLLDALVSGTSSLRVKVTFPEGVTIRRIASIASAKAGIDSAELVRLANSREFLAEIGLQASTAEGYLMPDTYFLDWGSSPEDLLREMSALFRDYYREARASATVESDLTEYETVILASLVEGEARTDEDRPIIAGLYLNRLRIGMLLQADPTIQYILPDGPRRLLYKDLEIDNPYNTYRFKGLPPTPINNPGRASLDAALHPTRSDYLYMVAKGDGSGEHTFSKSLSEHQIAVNAYRSRRNGGRN